MREIEIKANVRDANQILTTLEQKGIVLGTAKKQHDVVFCTPGQKAYEPNSLWFRIRTENDTKIIFTVKGDTGRKLDSIEHEVEVSDATELEAILRLMGKELYSDITKTRRKAQWGKIELCFDVVEGLGTYLEGEILSDEQGDMQALVDELWKAFGELGISREDQEIEGYDVVHRRSQGLTD